MVREIAFKILKNIYSNNGYSNIVLDNELKKSNIDTRDKALVSKIVYGTLTYTITIDAILSKYATKGLEKLSENVLYILRMGAYQIIYLDKIPKHAIVNESVELAKKHENKGAAGLVNAILRRVEKEDLQTIGANDLIEDISIKTSHPKWFVEILAKEYDVEEVKKICEFNNIEPPVYIRVNTLKTSADELIKLFNEQETHATKGIISNTLVLEKIPDVENNLLFKYGYYTIQDGAATLVGIVLNPDKNENVLDICSAPGGKTTHLSEIMENTGNIIASDIYANRLKKIEETATRLGITNIKTVENDGTILNDKWINSFDSILVDAPCSGFGVVRRKVDIRYQKQPEDLEEISKIQFNILDNCSKYLKVGGNIVYSTCTILKQENEDIISKFLLKHPNFEVIDIANMIDNNCSKEKYIKTLPHINNLDGFFISKLRKIKED